MSAKAVDYKIILKRDGQTQQQRMPQLLNPESVPIDQRTKADFYKYIQEISKQIKFYDQNPLDKKLVTNGAWDSFFELSIEELNALSESQSLPPHLSLWNSFIELFEKPKALMNTLTQRHLDFYYHDVLKLEPNVPIPDRAHVIFELKKNTGKTLLQSGTLLLAGKDDSKKDIHYKLEHDIVVNPSKVVQLKSLFVNPSNKNNIFYAPIANSKDGLGAVLDKLSPKWSGFGNSSLPVAQVGFCLASAILKMKEGTRKVTVNLTLRNLDASSKNNVLTTNLFNVSITGQKGWIGPKLTSATVTSSDNLLFKMRFTFNIGLEEPAVISYDKEIHGGDFDTVNPILQILVNNEKTDFGYQNLMNSELVDSTLEVEVKEIIAIELENDFGTLNPKKPFVPFGPLSEENANFYVRHDETFSKRLKEFSLDINWKNIPHANLGTYFSNYNNPSITNAYFSAAASFKDGYSWQKSYEPVKLFDATNAQLQTSWKFNNPDYPVLTPFYILPQVMSAYYINPGQSIQQAESAKISYLVPGFSHLQNKANVKKAKSSMTFQLYKPVLQFILNTYKDIRKGQLHLRLNRSFLFKDYREKYTAEILRYSLNGGELRLPAEPFAPEIQSIKLNYTATTANINFNGTSLNDYVDQEIEFFQYGAFGQAREHAYTRSKYSFLNEAFIRLVPEYNAEGELLIGLSDLYAEDLVSLLLQLAEGSANPEKPKIKVEWSVLCDNYWKILTNDDFILDTTNGLLTSGVIKIVIPKEATTSNTLLPGGLLWLKASIPKDIDGVCALVDVQSNAGIVVFDDRDNDPLHLAASLPRNTITKLKNGIAAIKSVTQPYASFGGAMQENAPAYYTRVSERLRHKERAVTIWDYERLILEHFPAIHKVKCINHATTSSFYAPGNTLIVVVPDLTNHNAIDPLKPKVDKNTLDEINTFLMKHSSAWTSFQVINPIYEPVKVSVGIKLKKGYEFNYYQAVVDQLIQRFLSPWIDNVSNNIHFGGKVTKSMIIKFLEDLEYIDYLTDLSLYKYLSGKRTFDRNVEVAEASNPAAILVSHTHHSITSN